MTRFWNDRPLGVKLAALIAAGAVALAVFALITVQALRGTGERADSLLASNQATGLALEADMMHDAVRADVLQALMSGGVGDQYTGAASDLQGHTANFQQIVDEITAQHLSGDVDAAVEAVRPDVQAYLDAAAQEIAAEGVDPAAAAVGYARFSPQFSALEESLPTVGQAIEVHARQAVAQTTDERRTAITSAVLVAAAGVLLLAVLGWVTTRSVVGPLRRVGAVVSAMAAGDLRGSTGVTSRDEVGRMATALEESMATMREVVAAIGDSSTTLASATEELSASAEDMARLADESSTQSGIVAGAAEQVSTNVQTVAAGSEQMGASIREIAPNAAEVSRVAGQAVTVADATTATVAKLGESSLQIASVVKVITSIAEQTNLLALNATIEPRAPGRRARASPSSPTRSRSWPRRRRRRPRTSRAGWRPSRPTPTARCAPSARSPRSSG